MRRCSAYRCGRSKSGSKVALRAIYDVSATPFFLRGSGYPEGLLFPWVVSDFALIDACGMPDVVSTSIAAEIAGPGSASTATVEAVARVFARSFASAIAAELR